MKVQKFNTGDLVILNDFGKLIVEPNTGVGLVMSGPYDLYYPDKKDENNIQYYAYDVMFGTELIIRIPQEFLERMIEENHEQNPKLLNKDSE